jgi:hypothetical protein
MATPAKRFSAAIITARGALPTTINPCVKVPAVLVKALKAASGKNQSIPVTAKIDTQIFKANVVRYLGFWRLYLNGPMRKAIGKDVGDRVAVTLTHDPVPRRTPMRPAFAKALKANKRAKARFDALAPSRRKEILRYLNNLKGAQAIERYIRSTIAMLSASKLLTR